jgi:hypothetical protein
MAKKHPVSTHEQFGADRWLGTADDCDAVRYLARNLPIEDTHIEDPEFARGVICSESGVGEWDPEAADIFEAELLARLQRMASAAEEGAL